MKRGFEALDRNGDGLITLDEARHLMRRFVPLPLHLPTLCSTSMSEEEVEALVTTMDGDGDGRVNFKEYQQALGSFTR